MFLICDFDLSLVLCISLVVVLCLGCRFWVVGLMLVFLELGFGGLCLHCLLLWGGNCCCDWFSLWWNLWFV